jgi:hypothetical protein
MYELENDPGLALLNAPLRISATGARRRKSPGAGNTPAQSTPPETRDLARVHGKKTGRCAKLRQSATAISQMHAQTAVQGTALHGNIIGRGMCTWPFCFCGVRSDSIRRDDAALLLFEQAARDARRCALLHELVEDLHQLLSEIGGVSQPGQFVRLQGWPGCGAKKLPRGLGAKPRHGTSETTRRGRGYTNHVLTYQYITIHVTSLWKSVDNFREG